MTAVVTKNKVISLIYVVRNEKGEIFEYRDLPISYVHGSGADLFPRVEQALDGHAVGDRDKACNPSNTGGIGCTGAGAKSAHADGACRVVGDRDRASVAASAATG